MSYWHLGATVAIAFLGLSSAAHATTLNMGDGNTTLIPNGQFEASTADTAAYLAANGVVISSLTAGTSLHLFDSRFSYNGDPYLNPSNSATIPSSNYNVLIQEGTNNDPAQYTLGFVNAVTSVSFKRAGASRGAATPEWSASVYDGATLLASVGQGVNGYYQSGPTLYSFTASNYGHTQITSIQFYSKNYHFAAFSTVFIDDLSFQPDFTGGAVPEPGTLGLALVGATLFLGRARRRMAR